MKSNPHWLRTHSADRTNSWRKAAGSRRNKKYRHIGHTAQGGAPLPFDAFMKPDHKARAISIETLAAQVTGVTLSAAAQHPDQTVRQRIKLTANRLFKVKNNG